MHSSAVGADTASLVDTFLGVASLVDIFSWSGFPGRHLIRVASRVDFELSRFAARHLYSSEFARARGDGEPLAPPGWRVWLR